MVAMLTFGVFSSKSFWGPLWNRSLGTTVTPVVWLTPTAPVLLCSWLSQLFSLWMGEAKARLFMQCPNGRGSWPLISFSPSQLRGGLSR